MQDIIGIIGATLVLLAFIQNQRGAWKETYLVYDFVNFIGAVLLMISAFSVGLYSFLILNTVWAALSLRDIAADFNRNQQRSRRRGFYTKWLQ